MYCKTCGKEIHDSAIICVHCGCPTTPQNNVVNDINVSESDWVTTLLLCFFLGSFGVHSFYTGKPVIGILQLLTLGGCGLWSLIDFIIIATGSFKDGEGKVVKSK